MGHLRGPRGDVRLRLRRLRCDGCPQAPCDDPLFDVDECPTAGDGTCDIALNDATCAYDGGDCCASTCQGVNCGPFDCRDPAEARHHDAQHAEDDAGANAAAAA